MDKINFTIEEMKLGDAKDVAELGKSTKELQIEDGINQYYSEKSIKRAIKTDDHILLVSKVGGKLAGFIMFLYHDYFKEVYFSDISIMEEYKSLGIGQAPLDEARRLIRKRSPGWMWALVQEENIVCKVFLRKMGLRKVKSFIFITQTKYEGISK